MLPYRKVLKMATVEKRMTPSEIDEFLGKPKRALVVTFSIGKGTQKARNLSKDSHVSLCIDEREYPNRTVILNGKAVPLGDTTTEYRLKISIHYLGDGQGRKYAQEMEGFPSTTYRVEPTKTITWYYTRR
jgi:hypothetical protein